MKPKRIHIKENTPIDEWAEENKSQIMDALYENVFEFVESEEEDRVVLQLISGNVVRGRLRRENVGLNIDFIIAKEDISQTIDKLMEHLVEAEEYEKCAELLKLKNKI